MNKSDKLFFESDGITPFIFIKYFGDVQIGILTNGRGNFISLEQYVEQTVLPKLKADLYLKVTDLGTASRGPENRSVFDTLAIFDGKTCQLLVGIIEVTYYNLLDFEQIHPQQATSTIINTKAKVVPFKMVNGFPRVEVEEMDDYPKLHLVKKEAQDYTYVSLLTTNADDPFNYYRKFVYRKGVGIIAFEGKWFYHHRMNGIETAPLGLYATEKYYYFK